MLMDVRESLTRERERERVSEKSVCACVKETWTTLIKVEKNMCVLCKHITHASLTTEAR